MRIAALGVVLGLIAACQSAAQGPAAAGPGLDAAQATDVAGGKPSFDVTSEYDSVADSALDGDTDVADVAADASPPVQDADMDGVDGGQGDGDAISDAQLPDLSAADVAPDVSDAGVDTGAFFPPYSQASECPELPRRCSTRIYAPLYDWTLPPMPAYWVPESAWVTAEGKLRVRAAWVQGVWCGDSRADLLPSGWLTVDVDPATLAVSVVSFVADRLLLDTGDNWFGTYPEGSVVKYSYHEPEPGEPKFTCLTSQDVVVHELTVGDTVARTHWRCMTVMDAALVVPGGMTITKGGVKSVVDIPVSICGASAEEIVASGCVCGGDEIPVVHPDQIPEGVDFIYFELDKKVVSMVADASAGQYIPASCCYASGIKIGGVKVPNAALGVSLAVRLPMRNRWRRLSLSVPVKPVGESSFWTSATLATLNGKGSVGFFFHDGFAPPNTTMESYDFYTTEPHYSINSSLGKHETLWLNVRLTHLDETSMEGEFEGLVAPTVNWEESATTQVGPAVPLENGRFRVSVVKLIPFE